MVRTQLKIFKNEYQFKFFYQNREQTGN